ncbi:MAG: hypothetical protein U1E45_02265 [Geminicoccaceae bacterium]
MAMRRVAAGQDPLVAARAAGLSADEVRTMLADGRVGRILATWRDLLGLIDRVRLHLLGFFSFFVVQEAMEEREPRVAAWFFSESQRGRDPFEVLAQSVMRMLARTPREPGKRPPPSRPGECDPMSDAYAARARLRVVAMLRMRVIEEIAWRRADLLEELGHDPEMPVPAALDWLPGLGLPPMPADPVMTPVPEARAGP